MGTSTPSSKGENNRFGEKVIHTYQDDWDFDDVLGKDLNNFLHNMVVQAKGFDENYAKSNIYKILRQETCMTIMEAVMRPVMVNQYGQVITMDNLKIKKDHSEKSITVLITEKGYMFVFDDTNLIKTIGVDNVPLTAVNIISPTLSLVGTEKGEVKLVEHYEGKIVHGITLGSKSVLQIKVVHSRKKMEPSIPQTITPSKIDVEELDNTNYLLIISLLSHELGFLRITKDNQLEYNEIQEYMFEMDVTLRSKGELVPTTFKDGSKMTIDSIQVSPQHFLIAYTTKKRLTIILLRIQTDQITYKPIYHQQVSQKKEAITYLSFNPTKQLADAYVLCIGTGNSVTFYTITLFSDVHPSGLLSSIDERPNQHEPEYYTEFIDDIFLLAFQSPERHCLSIGWMNESLFYLIFKDNDSQATLILSSLYDMKELLQSSSIIHRTEQDHFDKLQLSNDLLKALGQYDHSEVITVHFKQNSNDFQLNHDHQFPLYYTNIIFDSSSQSIFLLTNQYIQHFYMTNWSDRLNALCNFEDMFQFTQKILHGDYNNIMSVSSDKEERLSALQKECIPLIKEYIENTLIEDPSDPLDILKKCFTLIIDIESSQLIFTDIYDLFEQHQLIVIYYRHLIDFMMRRKLNYCYRKEQLNHLFKMAKDRSNKNAVVALLSLDIQDAAITPQQLEKFQTQFKLNHPYSSDFTIHNMVNCFVEHSKKSTKLLNVYIHVLMNGLYNYVEPFRVLNKLINACSPKNKNQKEKLIMLLGATFKTLYNIIKKQWDTVHRMLKKSNDNFLQQKHEIILDKMKENLNVLMETIFQKEDKSLFRFMMKYIPNREFKYTFYHLVTMSSKTPIHIVPESNLERYIDILEAFYQDKNVGNDSLYMNIDKNCIDFYQLIANLYVHGDITMQKKHKKRIERIFIYILSLNMKHFHKGSFTRYELLNGLLPLAKNFLADVLEDLIELSRKHNDTTFEALVFALEGTGGTLESLVANISHASSPGSINNSVKLILSFKDKTKIAYDALQVQLESANDIERVNIENALYNFVQILLEEVKESSLKNGTTMIQEFENRKIVFNWDFHKPYIALLIDMSKRDRQHEKTLFEHIYTYHETIHIISALELCKNIPEVCAFLHFCLKNWSFMLQSIIEDLKRKIGYMIDDITNDTNIRIAKTNWMHRLGTMQQVDEFDLFMYRVVMYRKDKKQHDGLCDDDIESVMSTISNSSYRSSSAQHWNKLEGIMKQNWSTYKHYDIDDMVNFVAENVTSNMQEHLHSCLLNKPNIMDIENFDFNQICSVTKFKPYWFDQSDFFDSHPISMPPYPINGQKNVDVFELTSVKELFQTIERMKTLYMDKIGRSRVLSATKIESMWFQILRPLIILLRKLRYGLLGKRPPRLSVPDENPVENMGAQTIEDIQEEINECFEDIDDLEKDIEEEIDMLRDTSNQELQESVQKKQASISRKKEHIQILQKSLKALEDQSISQIRHMFDDINNPKAPQHMNLFSNLWCHAVLVHSFQQLLKDMTNHLQEPIIVRNLLRYFSQEEYGWVKHLCLNILYSYEFNMFLYQHAHQLVSMDQSKLLNEFYSKQGRGTKPSSNAIEGNDRETVFGCICKLCNQAIQQNEADVIIFHCRGHHVVHKSCYIDSKQGKDDETKIEGNFCCPICIPESQKMAQLEKVAQLPIKLSKEEQELENLRIAQIEEQEEAKRASEKNKLYQTQIAHSIKVYQHNLGEKDDHRSKLVKELIRSQDLHALEQELKMAKMIHEEEKTTSSFEHLNKVKRLHKEAMMQSYTPNQSINSKMNEIAWKQSYFPHSSIQVHFKRNQFTKIITTVSRMTLDDELQQLIAPTE